MTSVKALKVLIVGDSGVGKTSIWSRFVNNADPTINYTSTSEITCKYKIFAVNGVTILLNVFDTGGNSIYKPDIVYHYKDADGILIVYDMSDPNSLKNVKQLLDEIRSIAPSNTNMLLVGNKSDLQNKSDTGIAFANANGI